MTATMKPRVFVTQPVPAAWLTLLRGRTSLLVNHQPRVLTGRELAGALSKAEGLICFLSDSINARVLKDATRLRVIATCSAGVNHIDLSAAARRGIAVTNTPGVLTDTVAELTWALILAAARRMIQGDAMVRRGRFHGWMPQLLLGQDLKGRRLGIVGLGRIGQAVARRAAAFGMSVVYAGRTKQPAAVERACRARRVTLSTLLRVSDVVSLHVPLLPATRHLINPAALRRMKRTAFLINTSRGAVVDEAALAKALVRGRLGGAGLDVFEAEPRTHPLLKSLPNVVLMPHAGSATEETRRRMMRLTCRNVLNGLA